MHVFCLKINRFFGQDRWSRRIAQRLKARHTLSREGRTRNKEKDKRQKNQVRFRFLSRDEK